MEACVAVQREVDRVISKFEDINTDSAETLSELIVRIQSVQNEIRDGEGELSPAHALILTQCTKKIRDACKKLGQEHKDLHSSVSKVGKAVDRNFVSDFSGVVADPYFELQDRRTLINSVIVQHFLRQGMLDLGERLMQDADFTVDESMKEPFIELHRILDALRNQNLAPALSWAEQNRHRLNDLNSSIEFKLHRLQFISTISRGMDGQMEALLYARNFAPFAKSHEKDVQILMGSMLYLRQGIRNSPYNHLLDPIHWVDICDAFTRDACALLGLSVESHLSVCVRAGCLALPPLLNIKQVMQQRQCSGVWGAKDELPVEVDVGKECRYHSIFACPILRQQSTSNNPPVRLICGHVISKDALNKLSNGNKMKCPYCPMEQSPSSAQTIYF